MEADWLVEIGAELPRIVVPWEADGLWFVDLASIEAQASGAAPTLEARVAAISEARQHPALALALRTLNAPGSSVFTSKCDVWALDAEDIDPLEFDAAGPVSGGCACYVDIVVRNPQRFRSFEWHERWMRGVTRRLRVNSLRSARVELVLREAEVDGVAGFAITLYVMGSGGDEIEAGKSWDAAVEAAVEVICDSGDSGENQGAPLRG